jgi:hypothetical protein
MVIGILTAVALISVLRRGWIVWPILWGGEPIPSTQNPFEGRYNAHPWITAAHLASGFVFMTTGPIQFISVIRKRWPRWHRMAG